MDSRLPSRRDADRPVFAPASPRVKLVLHRTTEVGLVAVVRAVMDLTRYAEAEATHRMWETFHRGWSVILESHRERAELYVEQFADRGLTASLEPA